MIKIYSIKEVIEASNNILNRTQSKNKVTYEIKSNQKKNTFLKKDQPLILKDEVINQDQILSNLNKTDLKIKLKEKKIVNPKKNEKLIEQLYLKFNKKIKKNTLKLIFELQKEVSNLNQFKDFLKASNKKFKTEIGNLNTELKKLNILNKKNEDDKITLNQKVTELFNKLVSSENEIENLRKYKRQLESELKDKSILNEKIIKLSKNLKSSEEKIKSLSQNKIELEKEISNYKIQEEVSSKKIYDISEVENKNKFFQEENLRIGSELIEIKKKHDILKKEIEKYENQKSNLISKINSVNEALSDTNILSNVFENKVQNKINVIDHNKIETEISKNLDDKIKNIFSNKD